MKRKLLAAAMLVTVTGWSAHALYSRRGEVAPDIQTDALSRGAIVSTINASGTLESVTTVQVGTQISGTVQALHADYNSIVKKGQVLARLDPSLIRAEIDQARASLVRAEAEVERLEVSHADAELKERRARELAARELIARNELETAELNVRTLAAQIRSARAQVTQARASLAQAEVNRQKTVIASPIDGIVIARNVDVGQTVAASLQAPTLFEIAADLTRLQVKASVDESDVGQLRPGQRVRFSVDAYPNATFTGEVVQVRLTPVVEQNVVTYAAIITAPNPDLTLRPGMTANVTVETARRDDVLRVPAAALRFKPADAVLRALGTKNPDAATNQTRGVGVNTVWVYDDGLRAIPVRTGISDGTVAELVAGDLREGTRVVTRVVLPTTSESSPAPSSGNPLLGPTPPRRF